MDIGCQLMVCHRSWGQEHLPPRAVGVKLGTRPLRVGLPREAWSVNASSGGTKVIIAR